MAMLDRYRKTGGFVQLLSLVETCGPAKQEKFLELIRAEDARWADLLKTKMIDVNRIYSWNDDTLNEIVGTLQDLTVAVLVQTSPPATSQRILGFLTHGRKRKIDDLVSKQPTAGEIASMHVKLLETVRKMSNDGYLRFEKFDEALVIEDDIEDKLSKATLSQPSLSVAATASSDFKIDYDGAAPETPAPVAALNDDLRHQEIGLLKKKIEVMSKENAVLRHELNLAKAKLDQIRKIA